jgi:hypothetical protein
VILEGIPQGRIRLAVSTQKGKKRQTFIGTS